MTTPDEIHGITDFRSLVAYLRDELDWEIPEDLPYDRLTYSYTADELGLNLDAQVEITQLRPILGQQNAWGVFFVDFDKAELPVTLLRRILSSVSRRKRASANPGDRALFDKNDLLFVSAFGKAEDRRLALAHFHQEPETLALPTLRVLAWDQRDTLRHMKTVAERLDRLRWPGGRELDDAWKARWAGAFVDRPREAIRTSKEMAQALADCARQIRMAIQEILPKEKSGQPLTHLFEAVKATLNKDLDPPKFADTYAQTIAYGLLSKRIDQVQRWRAQKARTMGASLPLPSITADALETAIPTNPFLSELLTSFMSAVGRGAGGSGLDFDELGLGDLVDLLNTANMEAVLDDFDKNKQGDDPVIHFYEGFLAAYDKTMKVQRGVFYTPKPVVSFIVRSLDEVLRNEFALPLGLADTTTWGEFHATHPDVAIPQGVNSDEGFVKILDPATGTGTFLVEVIDLIHRRMTEELWKGRSVEERRRLWNEYVPRHLLPRLYGYELMMAPYAVAHMKIGLKLADTGYDFSGLEAGHDGQARPTRARVFLTNALEPPQDLDMQLAFMNEALAHEAKAANDAKARTRFTVVVGNPPYSALSSNLTPELRRVVDCFRSVDGIPIRERSMLQFEKNIQDDYIKFLALADKTSRAAGIGLCGYVTNNSYLDGPTLRGVRWRLAETFGDIEILDLHGSTKKGETGSGDENVFDIQQGVAVILLVRGAHRRKISIGHQKGARETKYEVLSSMRMDQRKLENARFKPPLYLFLDQDDDLHSEFEEFIPLEELFTSNLTGTTTGFDDLMLDFSREGLIAKVSAFKKAVNAKSSPVSIGAGHANTVFARRSELQPQQYAGRFQLFPFDYRWSLLQREMLQGHRFEVMNHLRLSQPGIVATRQTKERFGVFVTPTFCGHKLLGSYDRNYVFPIRTADSEGGQTLISKARRHEFASLQGREALDEEILGYAYAVLNSPAYATRYKEALATSFARVPVPKDRELLSELIPLGTRLVALHLLDADAAPDLLVPQKVRFVSNGAEPRLGRFNMEVRRDGSGRVYLNDHNWFATVPQAAWDHWIGGYQPAQKWLKDRSQTGSGGKLKPGRLLSEEEMLHYRRLIVALEETGKLIAEVDRAIEKHGGWPDAFRGMAG